jgi:hypothetical protein
MLRRSLEVVPLPKKKEVLHSKRTTKKMPCANRWRHKPRPKPPQQPKISANRVNKKLVKRRRRMRIVAARMKNASASKKRRLSVRVISSRSKPVSERCMKSKVAHRSSNATSNLSATEMSRMSRMNKRKKTSLLSAASSRMMARVSSSWRPKL